MSFAQLFSILGAVIAGVILDSNKLTITAIAGSFVLLPAIFDLSSSVGASLSAKINHKIEDQPSRVVNLLIKNTLFAFFIGILSGLIVSIVGASITSIFFEADFIKVLLLGVGSIAISTACGFPIVGILSIILQKKGVNPDDVIGPIETAIFYILAVISMSFIAGALL